MHLSYEIPGKRLSLLERSQFNWKVRFVKIPKAIPNSFAYSILDEGE